MEPTRPRLVPEANPIFSLESHPWRDLMVGAHQMAVGNSCMVVAIPNCRVLRWQVNLEERPEEIEICRPAKGEGITRIFLDPCGFHLIVMLSGGDVFYLHTRTNRPKRLEKWRSGLGGCSIDCIAFDANLVSESSTSAILLGTDSGKIFEASVDSSGKSGAPSFLYSIDQPVSALHVTSVLDGHGNGRALVLASADAPTRLYSFLGSSHYAELFEAAKNQGSTTGGDGAWSFTELGALLGR